MVETKPECFQSELCEVDRMDASALIPNVVKKSRIIMPKGKVPRTRKASRKRRRPPSQTHYEYVGVVFEEEYIVEEHEEYDEQNITDFLGSSTMGMDEIASDKESHHTNTTEPTDQIQVGSLNTKDYKQVSTAITPVNSMTPKQIQQFNREQITTKKDNELGNSSSDKSSSSAIEKKFTNMYKATAENILTADLLKPGKFVHNIASITKDDVKIIISIIGVSTSSKMPKAHAMSYLQVILGENARKFEQSITIQSALNEPSKKLNCTEPVTFIMDGSKSHYTFMTSLASIDELTNTHEIQLSIQFDITIVSV